MPILVSADERVCVCERERESERDRGIEGEPEQSKAYLGNVDFIYCQLY